MRLFTIYSFPNLNKYTRDLNTTRWVTPLYIGIPHFTEPIFMSAHVLTRIANEGVHAKGSDIGVQMVGGSPVHVAPACAWSTKGPTTLGLLYAAFPYISAKGCFQDSNL